MKPTFLAACGALTLAGTMGLAGQTPTQPPVTRPQSPVQPPTRTDEATVTVTGCLKPWDNTMGALPSDAPARPGATPMPGTRYVLTDIDPNKAAPGPPAGQPGTSAPTAPSAGAAPPAHPQASQFIVMAGTGVNLAAHVNHKVSLTGTVSGAAPVPPSTAAPARPGDPAPAPGMTGAPKADEKKWGTLTATSLTMVSTTCTTAS